MKLIPEWRRAWRFWSARLIAALIAWTLLPAEQQVLLVQWAGADPDQVPTVLAALALLSRLIDQPGARGDDGRA